MRDHLFISYATEDWPLADWLTRRLTAEGYRVWCDRFKLLGGEVYPEDIDNALENETYRVLAIISRSSVHKDNPRRERTKALNLAKPLGISDFLIPLNADGLTASELPWMTSDITFIPFADGWAKGLQQLLRKLATIEAPRPLANGQQIAAHTFLPTDVLVEKPESVFTNCLPFIHIPEQVLRISLKMPIAIEESRHLLSTWPHHFVSPHEIVSFHAPPESLLKLRQISRTERISWQTAQTISDTQTSRIISSLLHRYLHRRALEKGLRPTPDQWVLYLPLGLVTGARLQFDLPIGGSTYVQYTGERAYWQLGERRPYRYHLAVSFRIRRDLEPRHVAQLLPTLFFTDLSGIPLAPKTAASRRKHLTRDWWNYEWFNRHLVIASVLSGRTDAIRMGGIDNDSIELSSRFLSFRTPVGIDESVLDKTAALRETEQPDADDDVDDDIDETNDE